MRFKEKPFFVSGAVIKMDNNEEKKRDLNVKT